MKGLPGGADTEVDEAGGGLGREGERKEPSSGTVSGQVPAQLQGTLEFEWQLT